MAENQSPPWSRTTKTIVFIAALLLLVFVAWRFSGLIAQVVIAAVLAYVLNPLIRFLNENTPLQRGTLLLIIYFVFILLVIGAFTAIGLVAYTQIVNLINNFPQLITDLFNLVRGWLDPDIVYTFGPFEFTLENLDWNSIRQQLLGLIEPLLSRSGQYAGQVAGTTIRLLSNVLFIWVISIYIALEIPRMREHVGAVAQTPGYRQDAERLMVEFGRIWSAYLRGQIVLGVIIGVVVGLSLALLGVQNALALGILSGLLEFIPVLGPFIGTTAAVIVAFFQPENYLALSPFWFAVVVLGVMLLIQQLENNILVPRIVGDALDLHPLLVMVGVFMGASLAGILGAILAAPLLASLKLLGIYAWRKMFDLPPFAEPVAAPPPAARPFSHRLRGLWLRLRNSIDAGEEDPPGSQAPPP